MWILFLTLLFVFVSGDNTFFCPTGFTVLNNKCVKVFTDFAKQADAAAKCCSHGGYLVSIHNAIDNRALVNLVSSVSTNPFWIGLECGPSNVPSACNWDDTSGDSGDFNVFANGYPMVEVGRCVYVPTTGTIAGKWLSGDCDLLSLNYICETSPTNPDNCPFQYNGNCYFPFSSSLTSPEAQIVCENECANLVSIHSIEENNFVQSLFTNNVPGYIRIGAITNANTNQISWSDGSTVDYTNIGYSSVNLGTCWSMALKDDVVASGKWISSACDTSVPFVCKRQVGQVCGATTAQPTLAPGQCDSPYFYHNSGTFYSPNYPYSYLGEPNICNYVLDTPVGTLAQIRFPVMNLDTQASISLYSRVEDTTPIAVFKGNSGSNTWYNSTTHTMRVVFIPCTFACVKDDGVYRWYAEFKSSNQVVTVSA